MCVCLSADVTVCKLVCLSVSSSRHQHTRPRTRGADLLGGLRVRLSEGCHSPASSSAGRPPRGRTGHCSGSGCTPAEYHKTILLYHMCLSAGRHDPAAGAPGRGSVGLLLEAGEGREGGQGLRQALRHGLDLLVRRAALEGGRR